MKLIVESYDELNHSGESWIKIFAFSFPGYSGSLPFAFSLPSLSLVSHVSMSLSVFMPLPSCTTVTGAISPRLCPPAHPIPHPINSLSNSSSIKASISSRGRDVVHRDPECGGPERSAQRSAFQWWYSRSSVSNTAIRNTASTITNIKMIIRASWNSLPCSDREAQVHMAGAAGRQQRRQVALARECIQSVHARFGRGCAASWKGPVKAVLIAQSAAARVRQI